MPLKDPEKRREYQRNYMRCWYQKNKTKHIALVRAREERIKEWLREYKESLGCEVRGETHPACLEFHHISPQEKGFSVGRLNDYLSVHMIQKEIAKCRLFRKEHWNERHAGTQGKLSQNEKRITTEEKPRRNLFFLE